MNQQHNKLSINLTFELNNWMADRSSPQTQMKTSEGRRTYSKSCCGSFIYYKVIILRDHVTSFTTMLSGEAAPRCTLRTQPLYLGRQQTLEWIRNSNATGERLPILDSIDIISQECLEWFQRGFLSLCLGQIWDIINILCLTRMRRQ